MIGFLAALFILSFLIFVHELGHFLAAKKADIKVEEFGLGYPPRFIGVKRGETTYSINLIPFGGFVRIDEDSLAKKPKRIRSPVLLAGILMNFLLAVLLFTFIYFNFGIPQKQGFVEIIGVVEGSPAAKAGMEEGDIVRRMMNGELSIMNNKDFIGFINQNLGREVELELERGDDTLSVMVVPRKDPPEGEGPLGVAISDTELIKPSFWQRPFLSFWWGLKETVGWTQTIVVGVIQMMAELVVKRALPTDIAGPVGMVQVATKVARRGIFALIQFAAALSVNLAVLNLLPIPALDGGRLLFLTIEIVSGQKPKPKWEKRIHALGMVLLLFLMLAITIQDISRLFPSLNNGFF